jgi:HlyD family secretion protein
LIIASCLIGAGVYYFLGQEKPVAVKLAVVETGLVQETAANTRAGTIRACRRAGISPRVGGQIDRLPVREGDRVERGQVLMTFWNADLVAEVKLAESEAKSAQAKAEQTCILARVAGREAIRLRKLEQQNLAAEEVVDKADGESRAQQAACAAAHAAEEVSEARLDVALAALDQTELKAPFAGIVAEVNGELGEFVTPSPVGIPTPPAVDLMDMSCVYVSAPIDEVDAPGIRVGMPSKIALDAFDGREFSGRVRRIAPYVLDVEKQARTVAVEVAFDTPDDCDCLLPGYSADIEIILDQREQVLRIPTETLQEGNKVLRLTAEGRLESRDIQVGLSNWSWTEVKQGVAEGDRVVVSIDRDGVAEGALAIDEEESDD